jgi:hypothetical protein
MRIYGTGGMMRREMRNILLEKPDPMPLKG